MKIAHQIALKIGTTLIVAILAMPLGLWLIRAFDAHGILGGRDAAIFTFSILVLVISDVLAIFFWKRVGWRP